MFSLRQRWFSTDCILCAAATSSFNLCQPCVRSFPTAARACAACALPIAHARSHCRSCATSLPPFERAFAAHLFEPPIDVLIYRAKFSGSIPSAFALGEILGEGLSHALAAGRLELPQALIPVPLHHRRLRQRGFNQAQLIAQRVAKRFAVPLRPRWASRRRDTMMQSSLERDARQRNVANAFRATPPKGAHVAIIDDVMTTGATATALAWALLEAGAARVDAWTVARAGKPEDDGVMEPLTLRV